MVKTLIFNVKEKPEQFKGLKLQKGRLQWTHMSGKEDAKTVLIKALKKDAEFVEDLLEEQRPNILKHSGLHAVVLSFPFVKSKLLQITYIINNKTLITVTNRESSTLNELFELLYNKELEVSGVTDLFSLITDALIEKSIERLEKLEEEVEREEIKVFENKQSKKFMSKANLIREDLFFVSKLMRGDLEVISEILEGEVPVLNLKYFGEHIKDRVLYLYDYIDLLKESINGLKNTYMSMLSHNLNQNIYRLTIIGALLIIPSIISGFFGMNVMLPGLNFWQIVIGTGVLCGGAWFILKSLF